MGINRLNSVQKATNLKEKSKVGINEMFSKLLSKADAAKITPVVVC